ncbi:MAG: hypothetical protein SPK49_05990 [Erysipelotrichaceae bacterium]|nr:hypothetical protein [Erysipelotrichaceae bacterium]
MNFEQIVKSNQEQAVASWIDYLNQLRIDYILALLKQQKENMQLATEQIIRTLNDVEHIIVTNRGGEKGIHGFLAEAAENGIANAKKLVIGEKGNLAWLNDNGVWDFARGDEFIQMKFSQGGGLFSLDAALHHYEKYKDNLPKHFKYSIPKDHYEKVKYLYKLSEREAYKKLSANSDPSIKQWRKVHDFFENNDLSFKKFEGCNIKYSDAQRDRIGDTLASENRKLNETDREQRDLDYDKGRASLEEMGELTLASAAIEGGTTFVLEIIKKVKTGTPIREFSEDDWKEILKTSGISTVKGGIRGASMYALSNCTTFFIDDVKAVTTTPTAIASAVVTASFGVAEQVSLYRKGILSELELIENSEILCLDSAVSAVASLLGQTLIPIPVLGAVIGNTVGTAMYQIAKDNFKEKEVKLYEEFLERQVQLDAKLAEEYQLFINNLNQALSLFMSILERAFSPSVTVSFDGSIELLRNLGVAEDQILKSVKEIDDYFMN